MSTIYYLKYTLILCSILMGVSNKLEIDSENVMIESTDIIVEYNEGAKIKLMEAYRSTKNDLVLSNNRTSQFGQLEWHSIGSPLLVNIPSTTKKQNSNTSLPFTKVFQLTPNGFNIYIDVLNEAQKLAFIRKIRTRYGIDVDITQIIKLKPSTLKCSMDLSCENEDEETDVIKVNGSLKSFVDFPLRVQFNAPINSTTRVCFEHNLGQHEHVEIDCTVSKNSKSVRQNFFALSVEQMSANEFVEKLFGEASEVYVSREQLANLASHIYTSFNVYEEYEIPESEFSSSFVEGLIQQTNSAFKPVPFETALQSLSKYSTRDLDPNEIRSNYSKVLKVKTSGDKTYIGVNDELSASDSQINSRRIGGSIGANFLLYGASLGVEFAKENEKNWTRSGKSIRDQLKDLNWHSKDHVEWQIDGDRIIPKSLNLGKFVKASFRNGLKFERIKRVVTNTILSRNFQIEYKTDHIKYDYLSNEIFDKTGLKSLRKVRTKSIVECLEACENLSQCHYVEFHNGCNLYDKSGYFYLVDKNSPRSGRSYVYRRRIYSKKELPGVLITSRHLKQIPHILDSDSCWEECLKEKECYIVSYNYHNSTCSLFKYKTATSWQYNVTNEEEFVSICYEKDLFVINKQATDRTTNKPAAINKVNETVMSAYFNESIKYEKTQMNGFYLSMHVGSVQLCWNECLRRRNECGGVSFGDLNRCHLLKKGDYYTMRRFDDWVSIFTEEEWPNRLFIESSSNYKLKRVLKGHSSVVYCLAVLQNGDLASGSADKTIKLWSSKDGSHRQTLSTSQPVRALVVLHNGNLISASNDKTLTIWTTRNEISISRTLSSHLSWVICLAVFANTDFASGSRDKSIRIWSSSGDHKRTLIGHTNTVLSLSVLPDGDLASGSADNTIIIWSSDDWRVKRTVSEHDGDVRSLVVLDTGFLVSASNDNTIKIWDENMRLERTYSYHSGYVLALVVHPSGDLISGSVDKLIQVKGKREMINGSEWIIDTLKGHSNWVSSLAVFNNGDIVSASYDNTIVIWSKRPEL